jgi:hypothetical protein
VWNWSGVLLVAAAGCTEQPSTVEPTPAPSLVINEVATAGTPSDWFEVVNVSDRRIDLSGLIFVDHAEAFLRAHRFPDVVLSPGERHVQTVTRGEHGFALGSSDGVWIYRFDDRALVDKVEWKHAAKRGASYARIPDVTGPFASATPTRGAPNSVPSRSLVLLDAR